MNGILWVLAAGVPWRDAPERYGPWQTLYERFARWTDDGTWERVNDHLRRQWRVQIGRDAEPSAGIIDSQSVKTTEKGAIAATTPARRSTAASATSSSIPRGW